MSRQHIYFSTSKPLVVGSIGDLVSMRAMTPDLLAQQCDIAEIRLDLFYSEIATISSALWKHLLPFPLLFTARCHSEGSPFKLDFTQRLNLLETALEDASLIDVEVANIPQFNDFIGKLRDRDMPWLASYHDFEKLPSTAALENNARLAKDAGASIFKCAAHLSGIDDLATLAHFQKNDHGILISSMGMGTIGPVSRQLCAQAGSVLNYGFVGESKTAPGQWSAEHLRQCILSLKSIL